MRYYIDGYNVIYRSHLLRPLAEVDFERAREALVDKVAMFCTSSGNEATVVFDGRHKHVAHRPEHGRGVAGLTLVYAPGHTTADAWIEREIYKHGEKLKTVVVSNDNGLRSLCRGMGALIMDADNFLATVREYRNDNDDRIENAKRQAPIERLEDRLGGRSMNTLEDLKRKLQGL